MDTKKTYENVEALAADLGFIDWVNNPSPVHETSWYNKLSDQGDLDWIEEATALVNAFDFPEHHLEAAAKDQLWQSIESRIGTENNIRRLWPRQAMSIAASILLLAVASWWWFSTDNNTTIQVPLAQTTDVQLPDGSLVQINAGSSITYDESYWNEDRVVQLDGEAFFEVEKGERFSVESPQGLVEVLGTSFNVKDRKDIFSVSCFTGKVRVTSGSEVVILSAGEGVSLVDRSLIKFEEQVEPEKTWMQGYFLYDNAPLQEVFKEIERQFDIEINSDQVDITKRYTGFFIKKNLTEALQAVCWPMRLKFEIEGKNITILPDL